jgi:hypothetical protein
MPDVPPYPDPCPRITWRRTAAWQAILSAAFAGTLILIDALDRAVGEKSFIACGWLIWSAALLACLRQPATPLRRGIYFACVGLIVLMPLAAYVLSRTLPDFDADAVPLSAIPFGAVLFTSIYYSDQIGWTGRAAGGGKEEKKPADARGSGPGMDDRFESPL